MARQAACLAFVLVAGALLAGCAPGRNEELHELVDDIAPAQREMVGCEWESTWGGDAGVKSFYGCSWVVPGTIARVGRPIVSRAVANGFTVYCEGAKNEFEVMAAHGKKGLSVQILAPGFQRLQNNISMETEIPSGHVLVSIAAAQFDSSAPHGSAKSRCVA